MTVRIYTDGSSRHANGVWYGAYAVAAYDDDDRVITQIVQLVRPGTNNASEMLGLLRALTVAKEITDDVVILTDSLYTVNGFYSDKAPKSNVDLWGIIKRYASGMNVKVEWVKGHHKDIKNKHVDKLAHSRLRRYFDEHM